MVDLLIANGADINAQNKRGDTPLHYTVRRNVFDMAKTLLEAGARYDIQNKNKFTVLDIAKRNRREKFLSLFTK